MTVSYAFFNKLANLVFFLKFGEFLPFFAFLAEFFVKCCNWTERESCTAIVGSVVETDGGLFYREILLRINIVVIGKVHGGDFVFKLVVAPLKNVNAR